MHIFYEYIWKMVNCALFIVVVLGLWLWLDSVCGLLVVIHTYLCYFSLSLSHCIS